MPLRAIVEDLESVPETVREHYTENEGKFVLSVEPVDGFALEDVSGLKTALSKERTTREKLEKDFKRYQDIDPDKAREALEKLEELANIDPSKEADKIASERLEAAKKQLLEKHGKEIETWQGRAQQLQSEVERLHIDQSATAALAEAKGSVELLLPHVRAHTRVKETDDGKFVVEVLDKDGNARIANSKGDLMTIKDLVAEMRQSETFGRAFEGTGQGGSGTPPRSGAGGAGQLKRSQMNREQKAAFVKEHGQQAFLKLAR